MKIKFYTLYLSASLALMGAMVTPVMADEWNKETKLEFSGPVEVPGKVLTAGKYVFKIADSQGDRNIVEIFSEDANGVQKFVTTILAIPDYLEKTPDKPIIQFEERPSGSPEAIHAWFYPGENTGWEFVYPKSERMQSSSNAMPVNLAPQSVPAEAPAPTLATAPALPSEPVGTVTITEDDVALIADNQAPALMPSPSNDNQVFADRTLPETAGHAGLELITGLAMLSGGIAAVFVSRRTSQV
jgi:hypothetical protein